jgi:hypothetical protein
VGNIRSSGGELKAQAIRIFYRWADEMAEATDG